MLFFVKLILSVGLGSLGGIFFVGRFIFYVLFGCLYKYRFFIFIKVKCLIYKSYNGELWRLNCLRISEIE